MANSFKNKKVDLTTTDLTTLYTVPTATCCVVKSILVSEDAGSGASITVTLVDSSSNIFSLFKSKAVSSNTTVELLTQPLVMEESEILKVQASDANELHVIASILEIRPREVTIMEVIKPKEIIETISNLKTGEVYKNDEEWKAKGVPEADIRRDIKVIMPSLDLFGKTK